MARRIRPRELIVGVEGLALLRQLLDGDDATAEARLAEVRQVLDGPADAPFDVTEHAVTEGYGRWAATYDGPGNPLVAVEQPAVWSLLATSATGTALDAACGTGRHTGRLVALGHRAIGVDTTPEMLRLARAAVPQAHLVRGDLTGLPVASGAVDLAVCALALDHAPTLAEPLRELARVLRPGGRLVLSDVHPVLSAIGVAALFRGADGAFGFVRNHRHLVGEYLDAFAGAGLEVRRCLEPCYGSAEVAMTGIAQGHVPEAAAGAYLGLPAALVWDLVRR
ncbi:MAG: class I SAM-dependent methyltransferase [Chloroflexi bacterium]|nr:MAG: class I SAM-dependent methyltransferase [Chloroflexota bacterium]